MQEILSLATEHWALTVYARNVAYKQQKLQALLNERGAATALGRLRCSQTPQLIEATSLDGPPTTSQGKNNELCFASPLFFENTPYEFEFVFNRSEVAGNGPYLPEPRHKLAKVNDCFRFDTRTGDPVLRGMLNFGNDIGWFRLPIRYTTATGVENLSISFEVQPLKMDLAGDLTAIYREVDASYPLWRFALAEQTEQDGGRDRENHGDFPLLWVAQFESLRDELLDGVKLIMNQPHSRLLPETRVYRADRIRGKLPPRLAETIMTDLRMGLTHKRYALQKKRLSTDTPENRFIKMVLKVTAENLSRFEGRARQLDEDREKQRLSSSFYETLAGWRQPLEQYGNHAFFKDVGEFAGLAGGSLVLQQKSGYSAVYRVWQSLKLYLNVLGNEASVSMKSVAELYEVWCFLEIRRILTMQLGFTEQPCKRELLTYNGLELETADGMSHAFTFTRTDDSSGDELRVRLAHEPIFNESTHPVRSWLKAHKPDIVLEATFPDGEQLVWVFDAKYRISDEPDKSGKADKQDTVPRDAINQMHRYRDALIYRHGKAAAKSRNVFGAFALFPGYIDQLKTTDENSHYSEAIREIGVGAFPLLPSANSACGNAWLVSFLKSRLGKPSAKYKKVSAERFYIEESARIPLRGMQQIKHRDLTLLVTGAPKNKRRDTDYLQGFSAGSAGWYHMKLEASEREGIKREVMHEIRYCAVATSEDIGAAARGEKPIGRAVRFVWPVLSVKEVARSTLTEEQAGRIEDSEERYWLFELGTAMKRQVPLSRFPSGGHHMKLAKLSSLNDHDGYAAVPAVYGWLTEKS